MGSPSVHYYADDTELDGATAVERAVARVQKQLGTPSLPSFKAAEVAVYQHVIVIKQRETGQIIVKYAIKNLTLVGRHHSQPSQIGFVIGTRYSSGWLVEG